MHSSISRRRFLQTLAGSASLGVLSPLLRPLNCLASIAKPIEKNRFLVMVYVQGGWDVTLLTDPLTHTQFSTKEEDVFIEYREDQILRGPNGIAFGPAAKPLAPFINDLVFVNGLVMRRDTGHQALRDTMKRGHSDPSGDLLVEWAASQTPLPMGIMADGDVSIGSEPVRMAKPEDVLTDSNGPYVQLISEGFESPFGLISQAQAGYRDLMRIRREVFSSKFAEHKNRGSSLEQRPKFEIVAEALSRSLARGAMIDLNGSGGGSLDTHIQHVGRHLNMLTSQIQAVADLLKIFKATPMTDGSNDSLFDRTTFQIFSEFSRTPYLNASKGKDHNIYTNSVIYAGGGLRGGRSVGGSRILKNGDPDTGRSLHLARALDYKTGELVQKKTATTALIYPENIAATTLRLLGAPDSLLKRELDRFPPLPLT